MTEPFSVEQFGGLNLTADPEQVGAESAVDLLNVDFDKQGRVRSRDGYDNLTASAASQRLDRIGPFYKTDGTKQIIVSADAGGSSFFRAYNTSGGTVATQTLATPVVEADFTRYGGPGAEVVYAASFSSVPSAANGVKKWDGSTWSAATITSGAFALEVQATDNRLVAATTDSNASRVHFSGAGTPETWDGDDYVDLTPGDGERITDLVAWRELVFVFKETKFFVFTGNSPGAAGTAVFNYRPVASGVGVIARRCTASTPLGVVFLSRRGIHRTTGGDPVLVSRAIDPIFRGGASSLFLGGVLNHAAINECQLGWHDERLYFAYPSGTSTSNDRLLVWDPDSDVWSLWDIAVNGLASIRVGDAPELVFTYAAGSNHIGRHSSSYTTDDGAAITTRYQSGFYRLGDRDAYTRWTRLNGTGAPTVSVLTDYGTSDPRAAAVTLGTAPAVAEGYHQQSYTGQLFSHKLSATSAWSVSRLQHDLAWSR